jgi:DNA topoisomerase-1
MAKSQKKIKECKHNGTRFPDLFKSRGFTLAGVSLHNSDVDSAEEMLWHYAAKLDTDYVKNEVFNKNFYLCLKEQLPENLRNIKFPDDFMSLLKEMRNLQLKEKDEKTQYKKDHKEELKKEAEDLKEKYGYAILNGEKQPLMSNLVEGPGIFIARGDAPLLGMWKYRTMPEDVTINYIGPKEETPKAPDGHHWKKVTNNQVYYIASYEVDIGHITTKNKEIRFGSGSSVKADADQKKFDKAVNLLQHKKEMEQYIRENLTNSDSKVAECALISWLLQETGIRIGNDKCLDLEADTVGASTLKKENIWAENGILYLNFLGKDSIPYKNEIEVPKYIETAINRKVKKAKDGEQIFSVNSNDVNKFLGACVEGCTPKLWRTAIATELLVNAFKDQHVKKSMTVTEKLRAFDLANLEVAKKLNHKKTVSKNYDTQIEKLDSTIESDENKFNELKIKLTAEIKELDKKIKKAKELGLDKNAKSFKETKKKKQERLTKAEESLKNKKFKREFKEQTMDIAIGTSRTNYCSPKIAYSICKDLDIPIEKIYSKSLLEKFKWAENVSKDYWRKYPDV